MDLSSLEGPPIADSRFTIPSWPPNMGIPSIHLDTPTSPVTAAGRPPRPRSTDGISMHKCLYSYTPAEEESRLCHRCHCLQTPSASTPVRDSQPRASSLSPTLNIPPPPPPSTLPYHPYRSRSVSDLTLHQPTSPMLSTTTTTVTTTTQTVRTTTTQENRLVWLESEKLWFMKPLPSDSSPLSLLTPDYETAPDPTPNARDRATTHSASASFRGEFELSLDIPRRTSEERSGGLHGSRWGAVARRRANRAVTG
ncbi:hypothetical protein BO70DRAFT_388652 [Aspergillus heteromorphus CBS 117.55]|uniref:Uncharacterized protein n=1 Tax=Aspergillus heteromorphus CBS 117.55 TaxID=1448321 RepID=A0A317VPP9_9EURO|nr:uncharacterized protein BO70DRAFT_388652 [Aspergillus heteromorphus CBS 117.55]PWY76333.1 hypothetical protein BO70DRAFT_388652 [Aspergillus heteromorphus CBS 117.55]